MGGRRTRRHADTQAHAQDQLTPPWPGHSARCCRARAMDWSGVTVFGDHPASSQWPSHGHVTGDSPWLCRIRARRVHSFICMKTPSPWRSASSSSRWHWPSRGSAVRTTTPRAGRSIPRAGRHRSPRRSTSRRPGPIRRARPWSTRRAKASSRRSCSGRAGSCSSASPPRCSAVARRSRCCREP